MTLKFLRRRKRLTQSQLANMLHKHKQYVCDLEKGRRDIKRIEAETFVKISEILDVSVSDLLNIDHDISE